MESGCLNTNPKGANRREQKVSHRDSAPRVAVVNEQFAKYHRSLVESCGAEPNLRTLSDVYNAMAVKKRWVKMPLPELVDRLEEKTEGRVLRVDDAIETQDDLVNSKPKGTDAADWSHLAGQ